MPIIHPVIRPPGEANNLLLQVTTGCSCNSCSFCGAYINKKFTKKALSEIKTDIKQASILHPQSSKVFLMDGDALVLKSDFLLEILFELNQAFPQLKRVSAYANDFNILSKTDVEIAKLRQFKLKLIYIGLESGSQKILENCGKRSTVKGMIEAVQKAKAHGIKSSVMALLGLGGVDASEMHALETAEALNQMQPAQLSLLSLMLVPGTKLYKEAELGEFNPLNSFEFLKEMYLIIKNLDLKRTVFHSNHASNFLSLSGRLPHDKDYFLDVIREAQENPALLRADIFRGL